MPNANRPMVEAREVLVLDSSTFIAEIGLMSRKGSALKHYLYRRGTQLVVPQAAAEEYERNLVRKATGKIERIQKELQWLAQFCGGVGGWVAPDDDIIDNRAKALASGHGLEAIILPETDDIKRRARLRDQNERPPSHRQASMGDCRIWEQCLDLLADYDVVFVSNDKDFCGHRKNDNLHPQLRVEAQDVGGGRNLTFHPSMQSLLCELRSEIPPLPDKVLFEFIYDAIKDSVQELQSNSECRPTSTGTIQQTRFTTETRDVIEVRLKVKDSWESVDGATSLPFEFSGSCQYHLGDDELTDLKANVVRLKMTEPDGSVRSVKGSQLSVGAIKFNIRTPPIEPERGILE